jgi:hypothetical protein
MQAFQWTPEVEVAFQTLEEGLRTVPVLAYTQPSERFVIDTDVSNVGIGGMMSQAQDRQKQVIAYYSKTLNRAERNYCVTQQELLAIVRMLEHFHYFYGQEFHLCSDLSALTWLMGFENLEVHTARWIQHQQEYNCTSKHCLGQKHNSASARSR